MVSGSHKGLSRNFLAGVSEVFRRYLLTQFVDIKSASRSFASYFVEHYNQNQTY